MRLNPAFQPFAHLYGPRLESLFGPAPQTNSHAVSSVKRDEKGIQVQVILPGVAPEDLEIEVAGRLLSLRGTSILDASDDNESSTFTHRLTLPFPVDGDASSARLENGVLTLSLPRPAADAPRRIALSGGAPEIAEEAS